MRIKVSIPVAYATWRARRRRPMGTIISKTAVVWTLSLHSHTFRAMLADTRYYAKGGLGNADPELIKSAKSSIRCMTKAARSDDTKDALRVVNTALVAKLHAKLAAIPKSDRDTRAALRIIKELRRRSYYLG